MLPYGIKIKIHYILITKSLNKNTLKADLSFFLTVLLFCILVSQSFKKYQLSLNFKYILSYNELLSLLYFRTF